MYSLSLSLSLYLYIYIYIYIYINQELDSEDGGEADVEPQRDAIRDDDLRRQKQKGEENEHTK